MQFKRILVVLAALCVPAAPAVALAASGQTQTTTTTTSTGPQARAAKARIATHTRAVRRNVRLARIRAHRTGSHLPAGYAHHARMRRTEELQRANVRLRHNLDRLARQRAVVASLRPTLRAIAMCESHHDPHAIGGGGRYRGLFQFDMAAWRSVGGHGDPARASVSEQYRRAAMLYHRRGHSPWPVCGR